MSMMKNIACALSGLAGLNWGLRVLGYDLLGRIMNAVGDLAGAASIIFGVAGLYVLYHAVMSMMHGGHSK